MMSARFIALWFPYLLTDWLARHRSELKEKPFAVCGAEHGRIFVNAANSIAEKAGIVPGMALADARALEPRIEAIDYEPDRAPKLLEAMADWCIRYTPSVSVCLPDGIFLDVTGCAHLMGGESKLMKDLVTRLRQYGYYTRAALADTPGTAWAVARYGRTRPIIPPGDNREALKPLPPAALRLEPETADRLAQLGIQTIAQLYALPRPSLTRRFGRHLCLRLDQALGDLQEKLTLRQPPPVYSERLPSPEGILTVEGIACALKKLLEQLCHRLEQDQKGLRIAEFLAFRVDGHVARIDVGTGRASRNPRHIFRLFEDRLAVIDPGLGIELFILSAPHTETMNPAQEEILEPGSADDAAISELADRLAIRLGRNRIYRTLPQASHAPERAVKITSSLDEQSSVPWPAKTRPAHLLPKPEPVEVMAPVPDYPPMLFRHNGKLHRIRHADGPERIEPEWWVANGIARDYYRLEDQDGLRYWIFRAGHYRPETPSQWFLHGYFA